MKTQRPIFVLLSILYLLSTLSLFAKKHNFKLPQYNCVHIDQKIEIDGKLNESVWKQAKAVQLAKTDTGKLPNKKTEAKMLWDNQYLYVGFICSDNDIWATISVMMDKFIPRKWLKSLLIRIMIRKLISSLK